MTRRDTQRGRSIQGDKPDWGPLLAAVGEEIVGDFMWMFEVQLDDGRRLHAYKHVDTRCYLHLDADGGCYVYVSPDRYRPVPIVDVLLAVIAGLPGVVGVPDAQIRASRRAVDRLEARSQGDRPGPESDAP